MSTHLILSSVLLSQRTVKSFEKPLSVNVDLPNLKMFQNHYRKSFISRDTFTTGLKQVLRELYGVCYFIEWNSIQQILLKKLVAIFQ